MSVTTSTLITDSDKQMIQAAMAKLVAPAGLKKHLVAVGERIQSKKLDEIWKQILEDFRATPAFKFCNDKHYGENVYSNAGAFGAYLNSVSY